MNRTTHSPLLFLLAALLMLLQGCVADGLSHTDESAAASPVAMGAYVTKPVTRADATLLAEKNIPDGQSIGVYAYFHDGTTWTSTASPNFMFNQQATQNLDANYFMYSPLKYWPNEETDKVSFIAYYPYTNYAVDAPDTNADSSYPATGIKPQLANSSTGLPSFYFKVNSDVTKQVDFMVSDLLPNLPDSRSALTVGDRVVFLFRHMTSKVDFRVVVDDDIRQDVSHFAVTKLTVSNIKTKGQLTLGYDAGETTHTWSLLGDGAPMATMNCNLTESYLMLPQTIGDDMVLTMTYSLTFKSGGTSYKYEGTEPVATDTYTYTNTDATVKLNDFKFTGTGTNLTQWLPNHHYVYTIRLTARRIEFTGQVVEWGDRAPVDVEIIED